VAAGLNPGAGMPIVLGGPVGLANTVRRVHAVKRLIYGSQATRDLGPDELVELLARARVRNEQVGLSGMLLYSSQSFLQVLEGDQAALTQTYRRISADPRHTNLRLLLDAEVSTRLFPDWSMGFDHVEDEELAEELPGYTAATLYPLMNPDLITNGKVAETLLTLYAKNKVR
jgi:hypothetical protein